MVGCMLSCIVRAQQMMANGGLERLMSNPQMRQMAERFRSGGGMPDMSELANDPSLRDMSVDYVLDYWIES